MLLADDLVQVVVVLLVSVVIFFVALNEVLLRRCSSVTVLLHFLSSRLLSCLLRYSFLRPRSMRITSVKPVALSPRNSAFRPLFLIREPFSLLGSFLC